MLVKRVVQSVLPLAVMVVAPAVHAQSIWSPGDTVTYADSTTAAVVTLSRARHYYRDSIIRSYTANTRTRIDAGLGRRRFAFIPPVIAQETAARVSWHFPNDLRVEILGNRDTSRVAGLDIDAIFDRPWFVPRSVGDSIQLLEGDFPENPALHPLAEGAGESYRYEITDSVTITIPGRTVRAIGIRVEPKHEGPALVAGDMWVDADTYEVVRLAVLFLGRQLWVNPDGITERDSANARRDNDLANRVLRVEADLEYGLYEARYWLPYRQVVSLTVEIPWVLNVKIPVRFVTTFSDYEINALESVAFAIAPDSLRADEDGRVRRRLTTLCPECGLDTLSNSESRRRFGYVHAGYDGDQHWEIVMPPKDSLETYEWEEPLALAMTDREERRLRETVADLAALAEDLPDAMVGRQGGTIAWEEVADVTRFNRIQGLSFGAGYLWRPGLPFTSIHATARFGLGDLRPMGSIEYRRDAPGGRFTWRAFRGLGEIDPWSRGQSLGNSLNAFFSGHDDADYYEVLGTAAGFETYAPGFGSFTARAAFERHRSTTTASGSAFEDLAFGDGVLAANPPVFEADFVTGKLTHRVEDYQIRLEFGAEGVAGTDSLVNPRGWIAARLRPDRIRWLTVSAKVGGSVGDSLPQATYRVGGPGTVRGHDYGVRRGREFWSGQVDVALRPNRALGPVIFFDIGDVFGGDSPLVGAGLGWSLFNGWLRPNLSYGINPDEGFRFDLLFGAPR